MELNVPEVTFVKVQLREVAPPDVTLAGLAVMVQVGVGLVTFTVACAGVHEPPALLAVKV